MRGFAWLVVTCLLLAGAATNRADRRTDRPNDEIVAVKVLAKVVVRRFEPGRTVATLDVDPFTIPASGSLDDAPPLAVTVEHVTPIAIAIVRFRAFDARGPPVG